MRGRALDVVAAWKEALLVAALAAVAWSARGLPRARFADVLAASYAVDRPRVRPHSAGAPGRGGDHPRGAPRAPPPPASGRRIRARPPRLGHVGGAISARRRRRRVGCRRRGRRARRPRGPLPAGLARLRCPRLVSGAARARLRGPLGASGELGLQHRGRGEPDSAPRLDAALPARERVRPRGRAALRRLQAAQGVVVAARAAPVRRAAVHAHAGGARRARRRARRARARPAPARAGRPRGRVDRGGGGVPRRVPVDRAVDELHRRRSSSGCARTPSGSRARARTRSRAPSPRRRATGATSGTGYGPSSSTRRDTGWGMPGSSPRGPGWRSRPASPRTPSSASTTGVAGLAAFLLWSLALLVGLLRREAWLGAAFAAVLLLGLQTDVIGVHWLAVTVWAAAGIAVSPRRTPPATAPPEEPTELAQPEERPAGRGGCESPARW